MREVERIRGYVARERDAAVLYRRLADVADPEDRAVLLDLAAGEEAHALHWEGVLRRLGVQPTPGGGRLHLGGRLALAASRRFGIAGAMPLLERHEDREAGDYADEPAATDQIRADEARHAELVNELAPSWREDVAGPLRAGVFGISDGTVSNLALVLGVAGSGASNAAIVTAGVAGLVAGATSMGVGEYVSVATQSELLAASSQDPVDRRDAWHAAISSLLTFAFGAVVPLLPFLLGSGAAATIVSLVLGGALLYGVGAVLSLLTLRPTVRAGMRQLLLGWGAAALTYGIGTVVGVAV